MKTTSPFELRGKMLDVESAGVYVNSAFEAPRVGDIIDETVTVYGVILARHRKLSRRQEPFAYIDEAWESGRGLWLRDALATVIEAHANKDQEL